MKRWNRIRGMNRRQIVNKLLQKADWYFSPRKNLRRLVFILDKLILKLFEDKYQERPEYGPSNLEIKLQRQALGGPFEPLDIMLINRAVCTLVGEPKVILEVGSGTGMFSYMLARSKPECKIYASEFHDETRKYAEQNRTAPNITHCKFPLSHFKKDEVDLVVAIDVVEHIYAYGRFLMELLLISPKAIITTPNKFRSPFDAVANTPEFDQHVREWSAGEFYWVLRIFWGCSKIFGFF